MRIWSFRRAALGICAAALLAGCGALRQAQGDIPPIAAPGAIPQASAFGPLSNSTNYQVLYTFSGSPNGAVPLAGLIDVRGRLYGTTQSGGCCGTYSLCVTGASPTGCGTVFRITPSGREKVLHTFIAESDGLDPSAGLIDVGGTLYGTTQLGPRNYTGSGTGGGTVFSITPRGTERVLHSFGKLTDGRRPVASLIDVKGTLYGTTELGGRSTGGTVFSITPDGTEKVLHRFGKGTDGRYPLASLIDVKGTLYGTTVAGGTNKGCDSGSGCGTVFSITLSGKEKVLHNFGTVGDGFEPVASLIKVNGTLYGTTMFGGTHKECDSGSGCGTVFSITPSGSEKILHSFGKGSDGRFPQASLLDVGGTFYGTTSSGGAYTQFIGGGGTVFSITPSGKEKVLHSFGNGADGYRPEASLINVGGTLYGTTAYGGSSYVGTVFALTP